MKTSIRGMVHARDEEQIDYPANQQQAEREEIHRAADRPAVIEPMCAHETENPQDVTHQLAVGVGAGRGHVRVTHWSSLSDNGKALIDVLTNALVEIRESLVLGLATQVADVDLLNDDRKLHA